uniref:Phosphoenolpyruvate carboxykinase (ATP) n=1 Tax=Thermorudis sp. TaxID=1969470 RepID=A0A7C2WPD7_9BACT
MPQTEARTPVAPKGTERIGRSLHINLSTAELYEHAIRAGEGLLAANGPLVVRTGQHTGRSPKDKFVVREPWSEAKIWWGEINQPISEEHYLRLRARLLDYLADKTLYAQDCYIGAHPAHRRSLRVYTETAWASISTAALTDSLLAPACCSRRTTM